jgi:hypothetical protein
MTVVPYSIFSAQTGRVLQTGTMPESNLEAMRSSLLDGQELIARHVDPETHRLSKSRAVIKLPRAEKKAQKTWELWRQFRRLRKFILDENQFRLSSSHPSSEEERQELTGKFQQSREIPQNFTDPEQAIAVLKRLWDLP